ncbi:hypothetical protein AALB64_00880 [Lachnospiraceae bacterium 45-P1]
MAEMQQETERLFVFYHLELPLVKGDKKQKRLPVPESGMAADASSDKIFS